VGFSVIKTYSSVSLDVFDTRCNPVNAARQCQI